MIKAVRFDQCLLPQQLGNLSPSSHQQVSVRMYLLIQSCTLNLFLGWAFALCRAESVHILYVFAAGFPNHIFPS